MFSSYGVITMRFFSVLFCVLLSGGAGFQFALPSSKLTRLWRPFPQKAAGFLLALPETREETLRLQSELDKVKVKIEWVEAKIERVEAALGGSTETALTSLNNQQTELQKEKNLLLQQQQVASWTTSGGGGRPEIKKAWVRVEEGEMP
uniref:Uncharacterized protein n=1 Tax=Chromera velia CCMP2878 TaxID=1169474 RepID=A0A0G4FMX3_9ALVE|eukprot:Cvel_17733.t1-p1 / transcript=Cvel_17733.t1 / gene=Cvel_17733 / organism=Chromera_velia_CCMP2878 / gene_product=hypothetical protein / transcript_product=hypothetical protein / location=Cvel_scaffold1432:43762-44824(-) / protein_length=147 / sequence_SO=supercontig / SO=protein_coding / is_pseudo=false